MKRFIVKPNFGHFSVVDNTTGKMVVGYPTKKDAELTSDGLNQLLTENDIENRITSLKTLEGYGFYCSKEKN